MKSIYINGELLRHKHNHPNVSCVPFYYSCPSTLLPHRGNSFWSVFFLFVFFFVSFSGFYSVFAATGLSVFVTYSNFPGGSSSVTAFHSLLSALKSRSRKRWRELEAFVSSGFLLGTFRHSITSTVPNPCS